MDIYYDPGVRIEVIFVDGQIMTGIVDHWTPPGDSEENIQELTIRPTHGSLQGRLVNFKESEVKKIKVID